MANKNGNNNNVKNVATVENIDEQLAEMGSVSKGIELAKKKIQEKADQTAAEDAMQVLGKSEYVNMKMLITLRASREREKITKEFLEKTKGLRDRATRDENADKNNATYKKLDEKYKDADMTLSDFNKEFDDMNKEYRDALTEVKKKYTEQCCSLRRILENHEIWCWDFSVDFQYTIHRKNL